jgi:hypothetical protein
MSPSLCGGTGKRKSASVKIRDFGGLTQTVPIAPRSGGLRNGGTDMLSFEVERL